MDSDLPRRHKVHTISLCGLMMLIVACDLKHELRMSGNGSGTYTIRITMDRSLMETVPDVQRNAESRGFRVMASGQTATSCFIVIRKTFHDISELNVDDAHFTFHVAEDRHPFWRRYHLTATLPPLQGVLHQVTITMPGKVSMSTAGSIIGNGVRWNCRGGAIAIDAAGIYCPDSFAIMSITALVATGVAGMSAFLWGKRGTGRRRRFGVPYVFLK